MIAGATYAPLRCMPWLKYSKVVSGWWLVVRIFVGKWTVDSRKEGVILSDSEGSSEGVGYCSKRSVLRASLRAPSLPIANCFSYLYKCK